MLPLLRCLAFSVCLAAASRASASELKLQFWHSMTGDKAKTLVAMVEAFNNAPEQKLRVTVIPQFIGTYEEGLSKVRTAMLAHRGPHVVQITDIGSQVMIDTRGTETLQSFIDKDPSFPINELLPELRRYYEVNGKLAALPFATSNPIIYYNVEALKRAGIAKPPTTFAELREAAKKLTSADKKSVGITWPLHSWIFEEFLARQGQTLVNQGNGRDGRATSTGFLSPAAIAFVELWAGMVKDGSFANVGRGWEPAEESFLAGRAAMFITSTSDVFEVQKKAPFKTLTAPIPARDASTAGGTIIGGNALWILKDKPEAEKQAAYALVKWMASKQVQREWHTHTGYFPIRADVIADLEKEGFYKEYPAAKTAIDQLRASPKGPATAGALVGVFPELRESVAAAMERILTRGEDVRAALTQANTEVEGALARYNKNRP